MSGQKKEEQLHDNGEKKDEENAQKHNEVPNESNEDPQINDNDAGVDGVAPERGADEEIEITEMELPPQTPTVLDRLDWPETWEDEFRAIFGDDKTDKLLKVLYAPTGPHIESEKFKQMIAKIEANLTCFQQDPV
jgi:hypothetical protein